ncbi:MULTISPECIES: CDP-diacylglycerol--glycerol-3-phosphate 3-phosphatidyltransferase [unclassified Knoellia]|uniref:CDP-diacylglycerol--glycerol-3-phosphate 3-phosphatidyltransferase n=1 Tax=Knoellia altitudinis TaxID=3404795 RepID=UPI00361A0D56
MTLAPGGAPTAVSTWNLPNGLTMLRILLVPVYGVLLLSSDGTDPAMRWWAAVVFAFATLTDRIDGDLARSRGLVTNFGVIADPIADKMLMSMAFVGLSLLGEVWWWVTIVVLVREWAITVLRFFVIRHGVMPAGRGGKIKTVLQSLGLFFFSLPLATFPEPDVWRWGASTLLAIAVVVTVGTGLDISMKALRLRQTSERAAMKRASRAAQGRVGTRAAGPGALVQALVDRGLTVATAESLTGGLVAATLTEVPGSSATVRGAIVAYGTDVKSEQLGVDTALLSAGGPVQAEVARQMAAGICRVLDADVGISTTGVAGPGPQDGVPVGTVFVAVAHRGTVTVQELQLSGSRETIRAASVVAALDLCASRVTEESVADGP